MKRSCQDVTFKGDGTKEHENVVGTAVIHGMEFHKYESGMQQINTNIYV